MNDLMRIPCVLMRGGTSKGPYFLASDLPNLHQRSSLWLAGLVIGDKNPRLPPLLAGENRRNGLEPEDWAAELC
jgi:2-methylaconitate cis-trans-isomerase PrpF